MSESVFIIDDKNLRRASLLGLLKDWAETHDAALTGYESAAAIERNLGSTGGMIILSLGGTAISSLRAQTELRQIRGYTPTAGLVVISDHSEAAEVILAFQAGASGFIPTDTEPGLALKALTFILSGGAFFPSAAFAHLARHVAKTLETVVDQDDAVDLQRVHLKRLTPRQQEVLICLHQGKSNKLIARELQMQEATVKVHVRQIMRKFGAVNRTQAALKGIPMAAGSGLDWTEERAPVLSVLNNRLIT